MPRNRLIVPMVTTIEGRPRRVTSSAVEGAAERARRRGRSATSAGVPTPTCSAMPIAVEASAMIAATERSISPEMISSAMAKAIIAFSVKLKVASDRFQGSRK